MHHFIFPNQDTWISSGSSKIDGTSFKDQNFGRDQILEVKKEFFNTAFDHFTRALVNFSGTEFTELSKSVSDGTIASDAKYFLRLYEAEGNSELSEEYKLAVRPISQSWTEGTGKFDNNPKNKIISISVKENRELLNFIKENIDGIEVVKPASLRKKIIKMLQDSLNKY